jgi:hypothetical protein
MGVGPPDFLKSNAATSVGCGDIAQKTKTLLLLDVQESRQCNKSRSSCFGSDKWGCT